MRAMNGTRKGDEDMIYPHTKVMERRKEIASLMVRGFSPGEIAEFLGISRDTVYNDIREIRSGKHDALNMHTQREFVSQLLLNTRERTRSLWRIADGAESEYIQLLALKELRIQDQVILKNLSTIMRATESDEKRRSRFRYWVNGRIADIAREILEDQSQPPASMPETDSDMPEVESPDSETPPTETLETPHKDHKESVNFRPNSLVRKEVSLQTDNESTHLLTVGFTPRDDKDAVREATPAEGTSSRQEVHDTPESAKRDPMMQARATGEF
jgi:hypothetical protein